MKLEIFVKATRQRIDIIKIYDFVQYEDEFNGQGSFTVKLPVNDDSLTYLYFGNYILFDDGVMGIIKGVRPMLDDDTEVEIYGYLTNHILSFRVFDYTKKYYDTVPNIARQMVDDYFINNKNIYRNISNVKLATDPQYIPQLEGKVAVQNTGNNLFEVIAQMFLPYDLGFEMYPVIKNFDVAQDGRNLEAFEFRILTPVDRTINNELGNAPILFSFELNNLASLEYEEDGREYQNTIYIASEGEWEARKILELTSSLTGEDFSGIDRIEGYVDARDLQSEKEGETVLTNAELEELMRQRGLEYLEEHQKFVSFDGQIVSGEMSYTYKKDFYKGDYVTIYDKNINRYVNLQVVSVTKSLSNGVEYFDVGFGYDRMTITKLFDKPKFPSIHVSSGGDETPGGSSPGGDIGNEEEISNLLNLYKFEVKEDGNLWLSNSDLTKSCQFYINENDGSLYLFTNKSVQPNGFRINNNGELIYSEV